MNYRLDLHKLKYLVHFDIFVLIMMASGKKNIQTLIELDYGNEKKLLVHHKYLNVHLVLKVFFIEMNEVLVQVKSFNTVYSFNPLYTMDQKLINMANFQIHYLIFFYFSRTDWD